MTSNYQRKQELARQKNAAETFSEIQRIFDDYVAFPSEKERDAVVLWTAHTHALSSFYITPRLALLSTSPGSGKTRVLEILERLTRNAELMVLPTPAVMWRSVGDGTNPPTMLVDEADKLFGTTGSASTRSDVQTIINAGYKKGAQILRALGKASDGNTKYKVFAPVALAGLGRLSDTIMDRSVVVRLSKPAPGQKVKDFELEYVEGDLDNVRRRIVSWGKANERSLTTYIPTMPVKIQNRDREVWKTLIMVADTAGPEWGKRARKAALYALNQKKDDTRSIGQNLLDALQTVFDSVERLLISDILSELADTDEQWSELTSRDLIQLLEKYDVPTRKFRNAGNGFTKRDLTPAWERHLKVA